MEKVEKYLVRQDITLRDALERINVGGRGLILLVDDAGHLLRTITDGDIRRLLLDGKQLNETLEALSAQEPCFAAEGVSSAEALRLMSRNMINHLPVVDARLRPVDLIVRMDLDERILLSTPHLGTQEMEFVDEAFKTNWIAPLGPNVDAFEKEFAEYIGVAHAAATNSGTAALHLALRLFDVSSGDKVFCSSLTFVASANPILYQGATPVFIDSEPYSWNMSPGALSRALEDAERDGALPKAVIVVNLYGQSADFDELHKICQMYGVPIVEDAAESLGATYKGKASGSFGAIGIFSFNGNKIITTSGGGMLVSDDPEIVQKARFLSTQGREAVRHYEHRELAYNYRMSNVLAGIGRGQLTVLPERVTARRNIFDRYVSGLKDINEIYWMPEAVSGHSTRWLSVCLVRSVDKSSSGLIDHLESENIEARPVWMPMHLQPLYEGCRYYPHTAEDSISDDLFSNGVCLPSGSNLTSIQQDRIIQAIKSYFGLGNMD